MRLGIETKGKRSDDLLNMAREQRNNSARQTKRDHEAGCRAACPGRPRDTGKICAMRRLHEPSCSLHSFITGNAVRLSKRFPRGRPRLVHTMRLFNFPSGMDNLNTA